MWYDEELEAKGFISWDKSDLAEFGEIYEGKEFTLHGRKWIVIECSAFSSQCKIKRIDNKQGVTMNNLQAMLDASVPGGHYRLPLKDVEQMASDVHYHAQLIEDYESDMIIKDKYAISLTPEERALMVQYHDLVLRLHCESWVASA